MAVTEKKIHDFEDVEPEDTSSDDERIIHPFNPNYIEIDTPPFTIGYLMDRIEHGEINMNTDFQREGNLWNPKQQSRLIESILLGLPLPAFYFDTSSPSWDIIDGLQRCCSIQNFCLNKTLRLTGLEYLNMNNLEFDDLDRTLQRTIVTRPITVNLLKKSPNNVRYILFKRLNTAGMVLKPQEIRNAIYQGEATKALAELASLSEFLTLKIPKVRMQDRNFVCRFIAFYLINHTEYSSDLDDFLNNGMELLKKQNIDQIKRDFKKSLCLANDIFAEDAFRKRTKNDASRKPINIAYFEVITVSFSKLQSAEENSLRQNSALFKDNLIKLMNNKRFHDSLTTGTGNFDRVQIRFSLFQKVMKKSMQGKKIRIGDDNKIEDI